MPAQLSSNCAPLAFQPCQAYSVGLSCARVAHDTWRLSPTSAVVLPIRCSTSIATAMYSSSGSKHQLIRRRLYCAVE